MPYSVKEAFRSMRQSLRMTISSICAIAVCFLILGTTILLYSVLSHSLEIESKKTQYVAYVDEALNEQSAFALQSSLLEIENIDSVEFVSRETAKAEFADYLQTEELNELPSDIFRHRFTITLNDISKASHTLWVIEAIDGIAEVAGDAVVADGYSTMQLGLKVIAAALVLLLVVISFVVIHNALSASFEKRRRQTYILRIFGVTEKFIRRPFVWEGLFVGIFAALLAFLLLWMFYHALYSILLSLGIAQSLGMASFLSIGMDVGIVFLIAGALLGILAGRFAGSKVKSLRTGKGGGIV